VSSENKKTLTPRVLRVILATLLVLILGASAAGFFYAQDKLLGYAKEISRKKIDATASNSTISTLKKVQTELKGYDDVKEKILKLRANDEFPEFRVVDEVNRIASRNNIPLASFSYGDSSSETSTANESTPNSAPPTARNPAMEGGVAGKTISLTVNFGQINDYQNYLQFLYDIEQNIPKMRVKSVGISSGAANATTDSNGQQPASSGGAMTIQPLTIELYTQ
jgi:hypothetical protein